jgi:hypothetical protein
LGEIALHKGPWHTAPHDTHTQSCVDEIDLEVNS